MAARGCRPTTRGLGCPVTSNGRAESIRPFGSPSGISTVGFTIFLLAALLLSGGRALAALKSWYPADVDIWEPAFNTERKRVRGEYRPLEKAERRWRICVSIPHLKDAYWLAVNYGLIDEAKRLGVAVRIYSAGGYSELDVQRRQVESCLEQGYDGLILSAVHATDLNDAVARWADRGKPVIDLINGLDSPLIAARVAVTFWDMGNEAGLYLRERHAGDHRPIRVAWFPGPEGAVWSAAGDEGLRAALEGSSLEVVATRWGDTGRETQAGLIEEVLDRGDPIDYIVGTTVSAEAAVKILRDRGLQDRINVMAYYYGPGVHRGIRRESIIAAPTDKQAISARMGLDIMVRILEGREHLRHVGPRIQVVDGDELRVFDSFTSVAPRGFRAIFSIND